MTGHQDPLASPRQPNKSLLVLCIRKEQKKKDSSFSEEKEAKRLLFVGGSDQGWVTKDTQAP
jgi:hypothetical protein